MNLDPVDAARVPSELSVQDGGARGADGEEPLLCSGRSGDSGRDRSREEAAALGESPPHQVAQGQEL